MQQAQEVKGIRPVTVPGVTTFRAAHLGHHRRYHCPLALCSNSSGPKQAIDTQILVGRTDSAAAKSLQSCPTLCDPINGSPPGSPVPGILQARILEWVAIFFSNAWKWKVKVKLLSRVRLIETPGLLPTRLLRPWDFPGKRTGVGLHCLLLTLLRTKSKKGTPQLHLDFLLSPLCWEQ